MFANLIRLVSGRPPPPEVDRSWFVTEVRVHGGEKRNPKVERLILLCWVLIAVKHIAVILLVRRYHMPFHQLWVNLPTWIIAAVATAIYYWRVRQPRGRK